MRHQRLQRVKAYYIVWYRTCHTEYWPNKIFTCKYIINNDLRLKQRPIGTNMDQQGPTWTNRDQHVTVRLVTLNKLLTGYLLPSDWLHCTQYVFTGNSYSRTGYIVCIHTLTRNLLLSDWLHKILTGNLLPSDWLHKILTGNLLPSDWLHCMAMGDVLYRVFRSSVDNRVHRIDW